METQTVYALANLADCMSPDGDNSPGANFLNAIESDVIERIAWNDGNPLDSDDAHEIADGAVPVYTHRMWATFVDLGAYQEDPSELGAEADDLNKLAAIALYMIGERLAAALIQEHAEQHDDDDDDD